MAFLSGPKESRSPSEDCLLRSIGLLGLYEELSDVRDVFARGSRKNRSRVPGRRVDWLPDLVEPLPKEG